MKKIYQAPFAEYVEAKTHYNIMGQSTYQDDIADGKEQDINDDDDMWNSNGVQNLWD